MVNKSNSENLEQHGVVEVNGKKREDINYSQLLAFVQQDDVLFQTFTVRECLRFAANMRLPSSVDKEERLDRLIVDLKLQKCSETKIGGGLVKGVSGGERKRTSIGVEIITNPALVFLDEPTTGLDSYTATNVVELVSSLAKYGRTVICTIHQPNSEIYSMFDKLMIIANGKTLYFNEARLAKQYFSHLGYECPPCTNPVDFFIDMVSIHQPDIVFNNVGEINKKLNEINKEYCEKIDKLAIEYEKSEFKIDLDENESRILEYREIGVHKVSFMTQFYLLFMRSFINIIRIPFTSYMKIIGAVFVAAQFTLVFQQMLDD